MVAPRQAEWLSPGLSPRSGTGVTCWRRFRRSFLDVAAPQTRDDACPIGVGCTPCPVVGTGVRRGPARCERRAETTTAGASVRGGRRGQVWCRPCTAPERAANP